MNVFEAGREFERELREVLTMDALFKPMNEIVRLETSPKNGEVRVVLLVKPGSKYATIATAVFARVAARCSGVTFTWKDVA